jgi:nucleolar protein 53
MHSPHGGCGFDAGAVCSLRQLAPVPTLLRDRYKSLQRRELVEPRAPAACKRSHSYLQYEPGARGMRENEMHAETVAQKAAARAPKAGGDEE